MLLRLLADVPQALAQGATAAPAEPGEPAAAVVPARRGPAVDARTEARGQFERGLDSFRAGRFREALHAFRLAASGLPDAQLWFDIARCHEELGELAEAIEHYRLYLRDRVDAPDRAEVERRIERLIERDTALRARRAGPRRGLLRVDSSVDGALVLLDGSPIGRTPVERLLEIAPGRHSLSLDHARYVPFRGAVVVEEGSLAVARADLQPLSPGTTASTERVWTWVLGVAAVAAIGTGAVAAIASHEERGGGDSDAADDLRQVADVALGTGIALSVSTAIAFFAEGSATRAPIESAPVRTGASPP